MGEKSKGIKKNKIIDTDNCTVTTRVKGVLWEEETSKGCGGLTVIEGDLTLGGKHTIKYTDVL